MSIYNILKCDYIYIKLIHYTILCFKTRLNFYINNFVLLLLFFPSKKFLS